METEWQYNEVKEKEQKKNVELGHSISLLAQLLIEKAILAVASAKSWKQFVEVGTNVLLGNYNTFLPENLN